MAKVSWTSKYSGKCEYGSLSVSFSSWALFENVNSTSCISWYDTGALVCTRGNYHHADWLDVGCLTWIRKYPLVIH
ncbi:hypothetical protein Y032_0679g1454 [Ancylostoma ceylanicum]|uniref:Uncharacterized protein n=1 Tax=Ancylostoma ceylanicum TaxID=53326 RepID=A0A016WIH7_9BILA|nr:hypothetical protein Y032_0679g1454 [Ancylostoma ceylanicum]